MPSDDLAGSSVNSIPQNDPIVNPAGTGGGTFSRGTAYYETGSVMEMRYAYERIRDRYFGPQAGL